MPILHFKPTVFLPDKKNMIISDWGCMFGFEVEQNIEDIKQYFDEPHLIFEDCKTMRPNLVITNVDGAFWELFIINKPFRLIDGFTQIDSYEFKDHSVIGQPILLQFKRMFGLLKPKR